MKSLKICLILFFLSIIYVPTYAWGKTGHHIVVEIAKYTLNKKIQDSVQKYLGIMTWESASTWMDEMRSDPQYKYMKTWHYINIEKGEKYDSTDAKNDNVVYQLNLAISKLQNRPKLSANEIAFNLKILFHLIGDIHQPLHVGYAIDRGGNTIKLTYEGKSKNLHQIWDEDIIESKNITYQDVLALYTKLPQQRINKNNETGVVDWLTQSQKYLDDVYGYASTNIDENYIEKSSIIIENQLLDAGIRLGKVLDDIFQQ